MGLEGKFLALFLLGYVASTASTVINPEFQTSLNNFNQDLFNKLMASDGNKNIIYSPFSIQASLAMTRMGAQGETAAQMDHGLQYTGQTPESIADNYSALLAKYADSDILKIANKVYVNNDYQLGDNFQQILSEKFFSSAENIIFGDSVTAANTINAWVESQTNDKIKNLISPDSLDDSVRSVLLNAIHFNGKWATAFEKESTADRDFYINATHTVQIPTMYAKNDFATAAVGELRACVLRLPYKDSDLSMLIFLPIEKFQDFPKLVKRLKKYQLKSLKRLLKPTDMPITVPKFKVEFEIELNEPLKKMGMKRMFANADFGNMLKSGGGLKISKVVHKAVIEVNEEGTEAAAATAVESIHRAMGSDFFVNHPFVYAIVNEDYVPLFQGTFLGV